MEEKTLDEIKAEIELFSPFFAEIEEEEKNGLDLPFSPFLFSLYK